ncbi:MAG: flagella basal body P-ring formation protein FlgA [Planctomycetes bacterium HGW-Planctomycetes-1]|nr:MAG: flagella basal body P-ring formation protein FlgA [Planctomycetes bacterium HGW-Planctomycetes-1]
MKRIRNILLITAIASCCNADKLQIHLPREITIQNDIPNLGQVAIIRGDELLASRAEKVTLGRISSPGQKITVDRPTVLSRLASSGIPASQVTLTGAENLTISQQHQAVRGEEFVEKALTFLQNNPLNPSICQYTPTRMPQDLILSEISEDIRFSCSFVNSSTANPVQVAVAVLSGDKELATREVSFLLKYDHRRVAAQVDIPRGAILSSENIKVENFVSNYPEPADWTAPYGLAAKRLLPANSIITASMVGPVKPPVILKRNQAVLIKIDRGGLTVTAIGKALQDGTLGEYIKVQNTASQRIIMAKVNEDGSVEPVF